MMGEIKGLLIHLILAIVGWIIGIILLLQMFSYLNNIIIFCLLAGMSSICLIPALTLTKYLKLESGIYKLDIKDKGECVE